MVEFWTDYVDSVFEMSFSTDLHEFMVVAEDLWGNGNRGDVDDVGFISCVLNGGSEDSTDL